jgi:hypothetical protein
VNWRNLFTIALPTAGVAALGYVGQHNIDTGTNWTMIASGAALAAISALWHLYTPSPRKPGP